VSELADEIVRLCNRHIARLMCDLEDSQCPPVYRATVRAEMQWLRRDVVEAVEKSEGLNGDTEEGMGGQ
jgi:hypothetical protein